MKTKRSSFRADHSEVLPFEAQATRLLVQDVLAQRRKESKKTLRRGVAGLIILFAAAYIVGRLI